MMSTVTSTRRPPGLRRRVLRIVFAVVSLTWSLVPAVDAALAHETSATVHHEGTLTAKEAASCSLCDFARTRTELPVANADLAIAAAVPSHVPAPAHSQPPAHAQHRDAQPRAPPAA
jgi:hypothetical protein